jgi:hypothetical protein
MKPSQKECFATGNERTVAKSKTDRMTGPVIHPDLHAIPLRTTEQPAYDRPFELELLHHDGSCTFVLVVDAPFVLQLAGDTSEP